MFELIFFQKPVIRGALIINTNSNMLLFSNLNTSIKSLFLLISITLLTVITACQSKQSQESKPTNPNVHKVIVKEVLQVTKYTYLLVTENDKDLWIAAPKMEIKIGSSYYYNNGMLMTNFLSKDLARTFKEITFVEQLSNEPLTEQNKSNPAQGKDISTSGQPQKPKIEKVDVKVESAAGGI